MNAEEIIKPILEILIGSGVAGLDVLAVFLMFRHAHRYINDGTGIDYHQSYDSEMKRMEARNRDLECRRRIGLQLYAWIPYVILASLILIALAIIIPACFTGRAAEHPL